MTETTQVQTQTEPLSIHKQSRLAAAIAAGYISVTPSRAAVLWAIGREDFAGQAATIAAKMRAAH